MSGLVLASGSATRVRLLRAAGLNPCVMPPAVDEEQIKIAARQAGLDAAATSVRLAETKALAVSAGDDLVIGADQMLSCNGEWFDKPRDRAEARAHLGRLSGRAHRLDSAVALGRHGRIVWRYGDVATLTMRLLSEDFIDWYLDQLQDQVLTSVGGYHLEGLGAQLFTDVTGDHFSILGLPLIALLGQLRLIGLLRS